MMELVLVHTIFRPQSKLVAFHDGHLVAYDGVLKIPIDAERCARWARKAWYDGYRVLPDGTELTTWQSVMDEIDRIKNSDIKEEAEIRSTDSADTACFDSGRQPATEHRIRKGKSSSG
jgi:hypothetical protein